MFFKCYLSVTMIKSVFGVCSCAFVEHNFIQNSLNIEQSYKNARTDLTVFSVKEKLY